MSNAPPFIIAPTDILADRRLTLMQTRVLLALYSFRMDDDAPVSQSRESISERCGYDISVISRVTAKLAALGWVVKHGSGGRNRPTTYSLAIPVDLSLLQKPRTYSTYVKARIPYAMRKAVFERDQYRCKHCGDHRDLCADHIYPERLGGIASMGNLQTLCRPCNSRKRCSVPHGKQQ